MSADWTESCEQVASRLGDYREGALEAPWRGRVAGHLAGCEECAALLEALDELRALLRQEPPEPAPGFEERIAARAGAGTGEAPWRRILRAAEAQARLLPLSLAATLAVTLAGGLALSLPEERLPETAKRLMARGATARELLRERQERLVEDMGALRLVVRGAFSSRLERIQEQLEDYRRLVSATERRRNPPRAAPEPTRSFENFAPLAPVAEGAGPIVPGRLPHA